MNSSDPVFLLDVDNTLLDNDAVQADLRKHLSREFGPAARDRYWAILSQLSRELGYRDYLGALQRYRVEHRHDTRLLSMSSWLVDYPFREHLYPGALDVVARLRCHGATVILSDGDVVFQPRKVLRSGLWEAVRGHVLIYLHKEQELAEIARRYPAAHYVLVDDKPNLLSAFKDAWGSRVTTVLPRQGHYAHDPGLLAVHPPADVSIDAISDLIAIDLPGLIAAADGIGATAPEWEPGGRPRGEP